MSPLIAQLLVRRCHQPIAAILFLIVSVFSYATEIKSLKSPDDAAPIRRLAADYGNMPLAFEPNQGQVDKSVRFVSHGRGVTVFLRDRDTTVVALPSGSAATGAPVLMQLSFPGANAVSVPLPGAVQAGHSNYLLGSNPSRWHTDIPNFGQVRYRNLYPGIDLVYHGSGPHLEQDFQIAAGADYRRIRIHFNGVTALSRQSDGTLQAAAEHGDFLLTRPSIYQLSGNRRVEVQGGYVLTSKNEVRFWVGHYNKQLPLVIDPVLSYSTYLAGSNTDLANAIVVDSSGNAYITGQTFSSDFPVKNPVQGTCKEFV